MDASFKIRCRQVSSHWPPFAQCLDSTTGGEYDKYKKAQVKEFKRPTIR
jgi:hypothetical protein